MTPLERAIHDVTSILESLHIGYMIVGGIANSIWGEPRATVDVDVSVAVDEADIPRMVQQLAARFEVAVSDAVAFVERTRVLPVDTADGVRVDLMFALMTFEIDAIRRARRVDIAGRQVNVVTPEDLVLMKILSERPRDVADAEAIVRRRHQELDRAYLEPRIKEFADALEKPEILERWRTWSR
jgi:predicted nucleotidyltransferase